MCGKIMFHAIKDKKLGDSFTTVVVYQMSRKVLHLMECFVWVPFGPCGVVRIE